MRLQPGSRSARSEMILEMHPMLFFIFAMINHWIHNNSNYEVMITSIIRKDDPGVHGYGRGLDFILTDLVGDPIAPPGIIDRIVKWVNIEFIYDKDRPKIKTLMWHTNDPDQKKHWHFHLQVMNK